MNTESPVLPQIWHFSPKNLPISFQMNHCDTSQIEFAKTFKLFYEKKSKEFYEKSVKYSKLVGGIAQLYIPLNRGLSKLFIIKILLDI
jgi:hypothetical protein